MRILDFRHKKRRPLTSIDVPMVPKAGLEPARISTVDFESTASTDFATSALKRYAENVVDYTCRAPPCKRQHAPPSLSVEIFSITRIKSRIHHISPSPLTPYAPLLRSTPADHALHFQFNTHRGKHDVHYKKLCRQRGGQRTRTL